MVRGVKNILRKWLNDRRPARMRGFDAAGFSRYQAFFNTSWEQVNGTLKRDYTEMVRRSRSMAVNNEFVVALLETLERNVIGDAGFSLQAQIRDAAGNADEKANTIIENMWTRDYSPRLKGYVAASGDMSEIEFDMLVLRTWYCDGNAFIRRHFDPASPFGVRYEMLDTLCLDRFYNEDNIIGGYRIIMGIKVDLLGRPLSYFFRESVNDFYDSGRRVEIAASEVIHLFKRHFPGQVLGYTPLSSAIMKLNQLDDYQNSELVAARLHAYLAGVWEEKDDKGGIFGSGGDDKPPLGEIMTEILPNTVKYARPGYTFKKIDSTHPHSNFGLMVKTMLQGVFASGGVSYAKGSGDYSQHNFSSLKEAGVEDRGTVAKIQGFLIDNWKMIQYDDILKHALLNGAIDYPFSEYKRLSQVRFLGRRAEYFDPVKDLTAIKMELQAKLNDPFTVIESRGRDPFEVLNRWKTWVEACNERGIDPAITDAIVMGEWLANPDNKDKQNGQDNA